MFPIVAALATIAGLASKASQDAADARAENREKALYKQQQISNILQRRAQMGGADTSQSQLAGANNDFLRQLVVSRRDTSGNFLPFVNSLGGIAQGIASDVAKTPSAAVTQSSNADTGLSAGPDMATSPIDQDERDKYLMGLAKGVGYA